MSAPFKEVVFRMVANKQLSAAQAMALVREVRLERDGEAWTPIAVIGLSGQFPGARNVEEFWRNLAAGRCSVGEVPPSRWDPDIYYNSDPHYPNRTNCRWGGFLDGIKELDSLLFNISPREAELMDPQQCFFLEQAWNAIEDAGYSGGALSGSRCGVFVGAGNGDFLQKMTAEGIAPDGYAFMGNAVSILAARISYLLNLKGPALAIDTACSSSLVAIHLACQSIAAGTCDLAIAGGVCVLNTPSFYIAASKTGMLSPTGKLRAFDGGADGFVPGEAAGALVLKRLDQAERDGDFIYGVIEGSGMNQDGRTNGITAPSGPSQTALELEVYRRFGISPESIGYIEAHGTGTPLGDPMEIEALANAFRKFTGRKQFCAIGSVKTNVGHTMTAAGVVSMIRVLLSLQRGRLTPSLHYSGNPAIGFEETPFFVNTEERAWESDGPRRAAISSFGFSGTNVHMVVREAPTRERQARALDGPRMFALSARTESALRARAADLGDFLRRNPEVDLEAVSFTLHAGRTQFDCRAALVARNVPELLQGLDAVAAGTTVGSGTEDAAPSESGRRIPLPTYPFERRSFVFAERTRVKEMSGIHPLLDGPAPCVESPVFRTTLAASNPFLRDHSVNGKHILPGVCFLEMACAAAGEARGIRDAVWLRPLIVEGEAAELLVRLTPGDGSYGFQVESAGTQTVYCRGTVLTGQRSNGEPTGLDLDALRRRSDFEIDAAALYAKFREGGVRLGAFCQGVEWIWMADDFALGELRIPAGEAASLGQYRVHPTLFDGAFQTAMAWLGRRLGKGAPVLVPASVGEVEILRPLPARCYAYVEQQPGAPDDGAHRFQVALVDEEGELLLRVRNFCARALPAGAPPKESEVPCYEPVWVEESAPAAWTPGTSGVTVVFRTAQASALAAVEGLHVILGDRFRSLAAGVFEIDHRRQEDYERLLRSLKPVGRIYFAALEEWGIEEAQERGDLSLFRMLRSLKQPAELYVLVGGEMAAGCIGLAMTAAREYRALTIHIVEVKLVEISQEWVMPLLEAERGAASGTVCAYRSGRRYRRRLRPATVEAPVQVLRRRGVYAIAGGAGGLGLTFARHLAETWEARVLLLGRSALKPSQEAAIAEIRAAGGEVVYEQVDITDRAAVDAALDRARARWGRLHGAIQAAMSLSDRSIESMEEATFRAVLAPKARGTAVLLEALAGDELDFVALFSSANSFFGNAGQANYAAASTFQDAYGLYAGGLGRWPVKVINWGFWGEVGAVASAFYRDQASRHGVGSISAAEGVRAFERALAGPGPQIMPMKITAERLAELGIPMCADETQCRVDEIVKAFAQVERYGRRLLLDYFRSGGLLRSPGDRISRGDAERMIGLVPKYRRLLDALLEMLERAGTFEADGCPRPTEAWCEPFVKLIEACLARYQDVLTGRVPATAVMFPNSSMELVEPLYKRNPISDFFNVQVAEVVARVAAGRPLRIIEIGAGTGGVTAGVLEKLRDAADGVEYHYTDVSPGFTRHGQKHFGDTAFLRFAVLDIEKDPESQGFEGGSFDLAIASNVLHATSDIRRTLRNVRSLLKPGGSLILNEAVRVQDFSTLTFGLTDGFWLYRDAELRLPHSPLLDEARWRTVLTAEGFLDCVAAPSPIAESAQAVLVARADAKRTRATEWTEDEVTARVESRVRGLVTRESNSRAEASRPWEEARAAEGAGARSGVDVAHVWQGVAQESNSRAEASRPAEGARAAEGAGARSGVDVAHVWQGVAQGSNSRAEASRPAEGARAVGGAMAAGDELTAHVESTVRRFVAQALNLRAEEVQARKKFAEYGVDSIVGVELIDRLNQVFGAGLKVTALFDHGSVAALTAHVVEVYGRQIAARREATKPLGSSIFDTPKPAPTRKIAVTGMSGRFPGAADVREFWENLAAGRSSIGEVPRERWDAKTGAPQWNRGGFLSGIDEFDPLFFQMSGVEAQHTDPQQRLFLEECWKAFEDAGYSDRWLNRKKCGVFAGVTAGDYAQNMSEPSPYAFLGNGVSILASRIAYLLNLKGPALAVDTACSSSLVALHLACQSILNGECEMALAGGVFLTTTPAFHQLTGTLGMLSPTGTCSAFDDRADGFVPGEGVGVVVLRPFEDAVRDGDHIYGVILGTGTNQDGNTNGITAPSSQSQTELAVEVYRRASVDPSTISYVEAHGTGTKLGDPVEIEGLKQAFGQFTDRRGFCAIGSVKTNIGHAGPAAGIAGLIKVLLAMEHRELPPSLNFEKPNRHIAFAETPFYVNREARAWDGPRRAAVSAFGLSGTNAHVVVEEAPQRTAVAGEGRSEVVALSAKTPEALAERVAQLAEWLGREGSCHRLEDIAYTLNAGRSHFEHRAAFVVRDAAELVRALSGERTGGGSELADAYLGGKEIDWEAVYRGRSMRRVGLPVYPFRRERYWVGERQRESAPVSYFRKSWRPLQEHGGAIAAAGILAIDETAERARALDPAIRWVRPGETIGDGTRVVICFAQSAIWALAAEASRRAIDAIVVYQPQGDVQDCVWEASAGIGPSLAVLRPGARWTTVRANDSASVARAVRTLLGRAGKWPAELRCEGGAILEPVWEAAKLPGQKRGLRRGGVYWITGGGGALGQMLARYLVREYDARVILTSRRAFEVSGSVECMPGDVTDAAQMRAIAGRIRARHGAIHGVFHAAGVIAPEVIGRKSTAQIDAVLAPKVRGAIALDESTREDALDFFCLFSSISAAIGDFGQCDYAAANRFLDAFAEHRTGRGRTVSIGWPLWADGGMRLSGAEQEAYVARSGMALLGEAEGFAALERCLAGSARHVLVVAAEGARAAAVLPSPADTATPVTHADHAGHIRATIASMLRLEARDLGVDVCLSAFGLDSLNMKDLAAQLSSDFRVELSPTALFEHNSIAALAAHLAKQERASGMPAPEVARRTGPVASVGTLSPEGAPWTERVASVGPAAAEGARRAEPVASIGAAAAGGAWRTEPVVMVGAHAAEVAPWTERVASIGTAAAEGAPWTERVASVGTVAAEGARRTGPVATGGMPSPEGAPWTERVASVGTHAAEGASRTGPVVSIGTAAAEGAPWTERVASIGMAAAEGASQTERVASVGTAAAEGASRTESVASVGTHAAEGASRTGPIAMVGTPAPRTEPIAIIGASGRFPQSRDLDEYWRNLIAGRDLISEIPPERWDWRDYQTAGVDGKPVSRWGGFMPEIDRFDAAFFGVSPREAGLMDPQHRLFLETAWKTLEDAGHRPSALAGRKIGVFVGAQLNEYMQLIGDAGEAKAQAALGNTHTMLANRVSYWFDFRGPSETVDTACSSALVAVHRAVRAIQSGDCEMAIAGGVSAILSPDTYVLASALGMLSPDGRCKTFDRTANGYVKGEGVGAVLLKPLSRALADGDNVRAVILSTAENHGGRANFLTAPNPEAQAALLKSAYGGAGIDARTVSYVEAHGTGTELGDPIEVDALKRAFRELADESGQPLPEQPFCGLGTVKSSVGHLEPAAGVAGLLKVVLALQARRLPPTLHVRDVNPFLRLDGSPFYLVTSAREWESEGGRPRRAGVSAFGFGGSNAHVVLEEHRPAAATVDGGSTEVVPFSARTEERLRALVESFCDFLRESPGVSWRDLVYTMQAGREPMKERLAVEVSGPTDLLAKLTRWLSGATTDGVTRGGEWTAVSGRRVSLPTYPFARERHWCDGQRAAAPRVVAATPPAVVGGPIVETLRQMLAALLYLDPALVEDDATFTDLGLDSILAVELVKKINDSFGTDIRATRLYDYCNLADLARHVGECAGGDAVADGGGVKAVVTELLADALYLDPSKVDEEASFSELGLDSILAVELVKKINDRLGVELRATRLYDFPNVRELAAFLAGAGGGSVRGGGSRAEADGPSAKLQKFASAESRAEARRRMNPAPHGADRGPLQVSTSASSVRGGIGDEGALARLVAHVLSLREQDVDEDTPLMELGLELVSAAELAKALREEYGATIAVKDLLSIASLRQLASKIQSPAPAAVAADAIAIIGMSGRFPGAANLAEFWSNLAAGVDSVTDVPADRWPIDRYYDATPGAPLKTYCRRGGFLSGIDQFDPLFFQISPQEAEWMDPQQRLFLEESWLALEDAGYPDSRLSRTNCAVYVGVSQGDYFQLVDTTSAAASQFSLGNVNSILASRIAYFLNLKGPAVALDTACSSSLVAIHLACQSLRTGECEMALAGGVSVMTTPHMHLLGSQGRMLSADGKCKTFDAAADGFVPAEGVGAVVLKRLDAAMRDGDRIHAVIRGAGVNQDGKTNGITAPSAQSQAALESAVYERFGLDPATFGYVEAHGTGTALGDPIELDALTESFRRHTSENAFCAIGSVKTNIGHSLPASGMAGLLKTVLAMQHGQIPPTLHCETENGQIDFASSPFYVNRELAAWRPRGAPRRAAISSFGFSGTNAHLVVEEAPRSAAVAAEETRARVFCLSAKTPEALRRAVAGLEAWLVADAGRSRLGDLSYTLCARRSAFRHRSAVVASTREELLAALRSGAKGTSEGRLGDLAAAWMRGEAVDWAAEFDESQHRVLSLPGYPFVRRRCWAKAPAPVASTAHLLIDECRPGFAAAKASKRFGVEDELLRDHRVQGQAVLPGVVYLEMARAAIGRVETGRAVAEIRNLVWKAPFRVEAEGRELTVTMRPAGSSVAFEFASEEAHAQGEAVFGEIEAPRRRDLARLMAACPREFAGGTVYGAFARMGIEYGPAFRCLEWVRAGERDAVGRIVPPANGGYAIHPGALDAALQTMIGFALCEGAPRDPMLPFALERYCVHGGVEGACFAHASVRGEVFDVHVLDGEGNVLVALEGFTARRAKTDAGRLALFEPVWRLAAPASAEPSRTGATLIFRGSEDFGLTAALTRVHAGSAVRAVSIGAERALEGLTDVSRIYFLGGLCGRALLRPEEVDDFQESSVVALFRLAKALIASSARPELIVVSNNVQRVLDLDTVFPQAGPLAGFARVLAAEYPELRARTIDVSAADLTGADDSVAQALAGEVHDEIALRRGKRFCRTLEAVTPEGAAELPLRERGVYIILGGMGGLGLTFARHLAATRRARLLLVGRSSLSREKQQALHDLDALGGDAIYHAADITDAAQMAEVRGGAIAKWGAVHGVIDSAFVLRDMSLANMDEARFREALDPKVRGTAAALWTFRGDKLDWFALFSSSISFTAGPGQANYAAASTGQDALGRCWHAEGAWPVRILNWGYWGSVGAVASDVYRRRAAALGVGSIEGADGIAAFHAALRGTHTQLMVAKTVGAATAKREAGTTVDAAAAHDAVAYVRRVVSEVLQLTADDLDDDRPFEEYGVDSLVSLTIVSQLEADLGPLAKTLLFEHPTIGLLGRYVATRQGPAAPAVLFPIRETGSAPRTFWVHSVVGEMNWAVRLAHHMGPEWPVFGFRAAALETERPAYSRLEEMAAAYVKAMRAAQPTGPYILGGFSFGGSVAFEMARQLGEAGERVAWLVLLDAYAPGSRALDSLARLSWDGFLPQVIANLLVHQWKGAEFLAAGALPKDDFEAQIRIAARHVRAACAIPQSEADIARIMKNSARAADFHAELQQNYVARACPAVERAILVRNRYGFVGPDNALGLPRTAVDDAAPDHGWSQWLSRPPVIVEADADHFSLGLEPAIEAVGRRIAQLIGGQDGSVTQQRVFDVVKEHVLRVLPDLRAEAITLDARLKDLGANSLDRIEVATCAMEELDINVPRTRLAGVDSLGGLVDALLGSLPGNGKG